jgi:hypothetical protein
MHEMKILNMGFHYNRVTHECLTLYHADRKRVSQMMKLRPNALLNYLFFSVYLILHEELKKR